MNHLLNFRRRLWKSVSVRVLLWCRYVNNYDEDALSILLEYNKEDVVNLKALKEMSL